MAPNRKLTTTDISRFFNLGLEMMDGDVGAAQEAVKLLANEAGLGFIRALADRHILAATSDVLRLELWKTAVQPLFSLITHDFVVDSAVLEQQVAEIFNFLHGVRGSRMLRIFDYIAHLVRFWPTALATALARMEAIVSSLAVLSKVVDCNSTAALSPDFSGLVSTFVVAVEAASSPEVDFSRLQALKYLEYLKQRQQVGDSIPNLSTQSLPIARETFVLRRDLPGRLSADGRRHDNDDADITNIKIMPTYEEIMSPRGEYLPTNDPSAWHIKGIRGRLDREFRLVREDTVGQLRDSVREMLEYARNPTERAAHRSKNSMRTYTYDFATTLDVKMHRMGGLEMVVRCHQLPAVSKLNAKKRKDWWMQCKRLQAGALVCMFDVSGSMLFCIVSDTTMRSRDDKPVRRARDDDDEEEDKEKLPPSTLSDDPDFLYVKLQLVDADEHDISQALKWYKNIKSPHPQHLVEFPGVLLASFKHTLNALQQMHSKAPNIPSKLEEGIKIPQYASKANFPHAMTLSSLDQTQSAALLNTLSRELSLIQGPPGTGKSYTGEKIIKVLLGNKDKAKLGPILCHLLNDGIRRIIHLNLRTVVKKFDRTKQMVKASVAQGNNSLRELSACDSWRSVKRFLAENFPGHCMELFGAADDGYQMRGPRAASLKIMTHGERLRLYRYWITSHRDRIRGDVDLRCLQEADIIGVTTTGLARNLGVLRKLRSKVMVCEEAGEVLEAHILTALLPSLRPQIQNYELQNMSLFERLVQPPHNTDLRVPYSILETQRRMHPSISELIRSTLYPSLKNAESIMNYPEVVGMKKRLFWFHHDRLEAKAESNDAISTSHSNDFEVEMTAALGDIAVITPYLGQLHRLRRRMESMFEICINDRDLEELETLQADGAEVPAPPTSLVSKTNLLKSVRVATVDNFQGEEAKVIIISLVRSNPQAICGFLRTPNRINVLLSRAQHGMYIIGNSDTYSTVPMWRDVIKMLAASDNFGTSLELQCPRHPDSPIVVSDPDHFVQFSPESGCNLPCDKRLLCGHSCTGRCHADNLHLAIKCLEKCVRLKKGCDHPCPLTCGVPCENKCQTVLRGTILALPCGHLLPSPRCYQAQDPSLVRCKTIVSRNVPGCGHSVNVPCCEDVTASSYECKAVCGHHRPCGHTCKNLCFSCKVREKGKVTIQNHGICQQICGRNYSTCRHNCIQLCHREAQCKPCEKRCEACNEPCVPCAESTCESHCPHTKCTAPCAAPCTWVPCSLRCEKSLECGHRCPSVCGEPCPSRMYCQQCATEEITSTCVDFLEMKAYHEVDLNEEPCIFPDCGHFLTVSSMDGQMGMAEHYKLDENGRPTAILRDSEPFSMDDKGIQGCATCRGPLRNISRYGRIVRRAILDAATKKFITYSNAKHTILAERLIEEKDRLAKANPPGKPAQSADKGGSLALPSSRTKQIQAMKDFVGNGRYTSICILRGQLNSFAKEVRKDEQPFQRVADLVRYSNVRHGTSKAFHFDKSVIQVKGTLLASVLSLECDVTIISDFVELLFPKMSSSTWSGLQSEVKLNLSVFMQDCGSLIELAKKTRHPREKAQGHILYARLCQLWRRLNPPSPGTYGVPTTSTSGLSLASATARLPDDEKTRQIGLDHVGLARELLRKYPSVAVLEVEIDAIDNALNGNVYKPVTMEELREVYKASAVELRGTGHWYTCENGHPFTINNCGMAMEEASCPECGAPIGGQDHQSAEGVRHATEIDDIARGVVRLVSR
ncbi:AAA domain-containing protein [Dactylonectria macrodidyma]|uniref:AAA domain-containing protein n=1 Tax=Dactylonectria macrodidyma TaxID=307937 RepID=A0A9P9DK66_9HYPO|nr:AAA domain-containing protein [Dactylonectria macrodidyma]